MINLAQPTEEKEINIQQTDGALAELVTRAEYDVQIATAKKYPRDIRQFIGTATALVTLNDSVAEDCIYALPRDGKTIEGPSARFGEIILHAWGHVRAGARVVNEDDRFITAQGVCHDLQSNTLIAYEVRRRITGKTGRKFNDDMIGVTGNAASSIALRNAILKVVPKAFWDPIYQSARQVVMGDAKTLVNRRADALAFLQKFGATPEMIFAKLGVTGIENVTLDHLVMLRGFATAIKEGDSTVEQIFADEIKAGKKEAMPTISLETTKEETPRGAALMAAGAEAPTPAPAVKQEAATVEIYYLDGSTKIYPTDIYVTGIIKSIEEMLPGDLGNFRKMNLKSFENIIAIERKKSGKNYAAELEELLK